MLNFKKPWAKKYKNKKKLYNRYCYVNDKFKLDNYSQKHEKFFHKQCHSFVKNIYIIYFYHE